MFFPKILSDFLMSSDQQTISNHFNSSPPSAPYMCRWTESALLQVMAWRQTGNKPLPEPMLTYYQLDHKEQISVKFKSKYKILYSWKSIW